MESRHRIEVPDGGSQVFCGIPFKFVNSSHVIGFDERAVAAWACELVTPIRDIVVAWAIRSGSELFEELQVFKGGGIDGYCFELSV